ncbi:M48 family metalloprotease [Roseimaritima sediminicola]|uniref:M48 family metalloprotease n=1 Tax=Roseimaritima sediminicola TaxID=2662066 RepID=UPI001386AB84|nr:M48 family metalloprotease [Roseimaritima sediminicola]
MPLYWFLLVVVSLGCGSVAGPEVPAVRAVVATLGVVLAWGLLGKVAAAVTTRQLDSGDDDPVTAVRIYERQISILRWAGIVAAAMCLVGFGLAGLIDSLTVCRWSMAARATLLMLPAAAISTLLWWVDHQFGVAHQWVPRGVRSLLQEAWAAFRIQGAWLVLPVLLLLALVDGVLLIPGLPVVAGGAIAAGVTLVCVPIGLPWLARRIWKTESIADSQHAWLTQLAAATGYPRLCIRRWDTGHKTSNALVAGFLPGCRMMLLSDRLLDRLPREQLAMIALHEIAHLRRWHVPLRMAAVIPAWATIYCVEQVLAGYAWTEVLGVASGITASLAFLHVVSRRTELDADAVACRLAVRAAAEVEGLPGRLSEAAAAMSAALDAVTADSPAARRGSWMHPSLPARQNSLARLDAHRCVPGIASAEPFGR